MNNKESSPLESKAVIPALASIALWSTVAVAFKKALLGLDPTDLVILASFVSWLSLALVLIIREIFKPGNTRTTHLSPVSNRKQRVVALLLGLMNPVAYYLVLFAAYDRLPAQAAQPLNYTWPLFLALLAAPINHRYPSVREIIAIVISFVGVILISWRPSGGDAPLDGLGVALALGSGVIWAIYWLVGNTLSMDGTRRLFLGFTLAVLVLGILWWFRGFPLPGNRQTYLAVLWIGLFEMGITFLLWNRALSMTARPAGIGNLVYLGPFISLIWIRLFLGEQIRSATVIGLLVIVSGILYGQGFFRQFSKKS